jgi:transposase
LIEVPWANPESSFTLLFEAYAALLVKDGMSVSKAGSYVNESYKVIHRIIKSLVVTAMIEQPLEDVRELAVDETSTKKGHNYFTVLTDRKRKKVVGLSEGKSHESMKNALEEMEYRGADKTKVRCITMDMSPSYIGAAKELLSQADIVFDRYHISAQMNKAVDEVRRIDQRNYHGLTKSRYLWLKNNKNLTAKDKDRVDHLSQAYPNIGTAYRLKELLREVLDEAMNSHLLKGLKTWMKMAMKTEIKPIEKFVTMLTKHWYGIKTYFKRLSTNAYAERVNLKIQEIKRIAKGYRNTSNYKMMIYFHLGGLQLGLPTTKG